MVEPMVEKHWPAVAAIHAEGIATGDATFTTHPAPNLAAFAEGKLACGCLVARDTDSDGVVGWTALSSVSSRAVYAGVAEVGIHVTTSARRRGVGATLMRELIARSEHAGLWTLQAAIFPENRASLVLHARHGFRVIGRRERIGRMTIGPRTGEWRDTVLLERRSAVVN